jgi:adenosylmethionine-8-amino-7-oxononanoate aminotransferase|tara:strand:- start:3647 stop:5011 length:1365 start_codon:yes stop_codon:yes gene_type:complete
MNDQLNISGEKIEELQNLASQNLFMHAQQINDWAGNLKIFVKGEGVWVTDINGNKYLDSLGGLWFKSVGYGRKEIAEAIYKQACEIETPPSNAACIPQIELAGKIAELYPDKSARSFFTSGGSESVETAVKMAKKYQINTGKPGAYKVISRRYSYHGATAMAVSLGKPSTSDTMGPEMPGVIHVQNWDSYRIPNNINPVDYAIQCANEFEAAILHTGSDTVAAMIAEPISAAFGIHIPPKEYWQRLREIADKYKVVLIADEVITGFGRTGKYFATDHWDIIPDITTVAKSLTSGYSPLGAAIATKKIADSFMGSENEMFRHLITFGGHPVSCAAGLKNLEIFEKEDLVKKSEVMGIYLLNKLSSLKNLKIVGDVRGLGLLAAIELVQDKKNKTKIPLSFEIQKKIPNYLFDRNIITFRAGDIISLCPPLSITIDEIDFLVEALTSAITKVEKEI